MKLLIMKGAEVDAMTDIGTPLMVAAYNGRKEFLKVLLDNNADVRKSLMLFFYSVFFFFLGLHFPLRFSMFFFHFDAKCLRVMH